MKDKNISYEDFNNKYASLIEVIININKKELIHPINSQVHFKLPLSLRNSADENSNIKDQIKILLRAYEKEASNILTIILSINKLNNQLFESIKIVNQEFIKNKQNKEDMNIVKDNKEIIQKNISKSSKINNLIDKYYSY